MGAETNQEKENRTRNPHPFAGNYSDGSYKHQRNNQRKYSSQLSDSQDAAYYQPFSEEPYQQQYQHQQQEMRRQISLDSLRVKGQPTGHFYAAAAAGAEDRSSAQGNYDKSIIVRFNRVREMDATS